jgi:catechol 2,3-dioxygenase-like lactoylglutathione lyase family enzyme
MTEPILDGSIAQIGIVVHDIAAAARAWSALLGVPVPEVITTDLVEEAQTEYVGEPSTARAKLAFFRLGGVQIELIEPIGEPSTWKDQLDRHGDSLHHIAFRIDGMRDTLASLDAKGLPLVQRGEFTGGRYAYVDGSAQLGTILELLEND